MRILSLLGRWTVIKDIIKGNIWWRYLAHWVSGYSYKDLLVKLIEKKMSPSDFQDQPLFLKRDTGQVPVMHITSDIFKETTCCHCQSYKKVKASRPRGHQPLPASPPPLPWGIPSGTPPGCPFQLVGTAPQLLPGATGRKEVTTQTSQLALWEQQACETRVKGHLLSYSMKADVFTMW